MYKREHNFENIISNLKPITLKKVFIFTSIIMIDNIKRN